MDKRVLGFELLAIVATWLSLGCTITDYPIITDDRGSYSGIIRTGHKAWVTPSTQFATIWDDGAEELFAMVYQNQYGDQHLYTHASLDPSATLVGFAVLDQTYCDWRFDGCEVLRAWNPHDPAVDDSYDYELFDQNCAGARSLSLLDAYTSRLGECGDHFRGRNYQSLAREFSDLGTAQWRGQTVYDVPLDDDRFSVTLNGELVPILGQPHLYVDEKLRSLMPVQPSARQTLRWLAEWVARNPSGQARVEMTYGSVSSQSEVRILEQPLRQLVNRF